jgi:hypothetical protein
VRVFIVGAHIAFAKRMPLVAAEYFRLVFVPNAGWCVWLFRFYIIGCGGPNEVACSIG